MPTIRELKDELRTRKMPTTGDKAKLVARLSATSYGSAHIKKRTKEDLKRQSAADKQRVRQAASIVASAGNTRIETYPGSTSREGPETILQIMSILNSIVASADLASIVARSNAIFGGPPCNKLVVSAP